MVRPTLEARRCFEDFKKKKQYLIQQLATIKISEVTDNKCLLDWTTEIDPEIFADAIHQGMLISISGLRKVLDDS